VVIYIAFPLGIAPAYDCSGNRQDTHRDKNGTEPHDSGTPRLLSFSKRNEIHSIICLRAAHEKGVMARSLGLRVRRNNHGNVRSNRFSQIDGAGKGGRERLAVP